MSLSQPIMNLERTDNIPQESTFVVEMGDGAGTKAVTKETLTKEVGEALKVGNLEELQTEAKSSIVAAINEAAQSGSGGSAVDILDTKEEIEANTEPGKAAGAQAVKEMFGALNDNINGNILTYNESEDAYYIQHGADAVPKKLGKSGNVKIFDIRNIDKDGAKTNAHYYFTFLNNYSRFYIETIKCYRYDSVYLGTSGLNISAANGDIIYKRTFSGGTPAVYNDISVDLSPYKGENITVDFYLSQYGCEISNISIE